MSMQRAFRMGNQEMEPSLDDAKMVLEAHSRAMYVFFFSVCCCLLVVYSYTLY
jgi:hypothetical protein